MNMKKPVLFNLIIPIIEFFLSVICISYLFQMEDIEFSNFSLYSILIIIKGFFFIYYTLMIFKSFFGLLSGICKI